MSVKPLRADPDFDVLTDTDKFEVKTRQPDGCSHVHADMSLMSRFYQHLMQFYVIGAEEQIQRRSVFAADLEDRYSLSKCQAKHQGWC